MLGIFGLEGSVIVCDVYGVWWLGPVYYASAWDLCTERTFTGWVSSNNYTFYYICQSGYPALPEDLNNFKPMKIKLAWFWRITKSKFKENRPGGSRVLIRYTNRQVRWLQL